jgi:CelD/BcsL family acetyltransferase involved in cellulose biosynthesis
MHNVTVDLCSPGQDIAEHWSALTRRAAANVFMNPAALQAAHARDGARVHVLLGWLRDAQPARLVGLWAIQQSRLTPLWPSFLSAPPYSNAWLSNPVIDPEFMDDAMAAFLDAIASDRRLPNVVRLRYLDATSDSYAAILKAFAARGAHTLKVWERERAFVTRDVGLKRSGSTRKKLRQDWNRLCAAGTVEIVNERSHGAAQEAFEIYLTMEVASWKGANGTALLCDDGEASFARRLIAALAAERNASVALLKLDGRAIAAQVLLYCGAMAYTWRTAFDADFDKFSPGALLVDKMTERLFATEGIDAIESCSPQGGFMKQMWDGRRISVDLLADLGPRKSLEFTAVAMSERSDALRDIRDKLRATSWWVKAHWRGGRPVST